MTYIRDVLNEAVAGVDVADTPEGLSAIHHPGCVAAIWRRSPLPGFQSWIDALTPEQLPKLRVTLRPERVCEALLEATRTCGLPDCAERTMFVEDGAALAAIFANVTRAPYLRLHLDVIPKIPKSSCRKVHIDAVTAQLVCTYRGTGTQYGVSTELAERPLVFTVPTGVPIVLRGATWPEHPHAGFRHRSLSIEGTGETSLFLVLDPIVDLRRQPNPAFVTRH